MAQRVAIAWFRSGNGGLVLRLAQLILLGLPKSH